MRMPRTPQVLAATVVAATTLMAVALGVSGCGNKAEPPKPSPGSSSGAPASAAAPPPASAPQPQPQGAPGEYAGLLITASDIKAPEPFTASPPTPNPNGQSGVATTFSDPDGSVVIDDIIQVFADPAAATNALEAAKAGLGNGLKGPKTGQINIGTGGTTVFGNKLDGSKGQMIVVFTEGRALVTLKFSGPLSLTPPPEFVNDVAQKQDAAVKKGLGG